MVTEDEVVEATAAALTKAGWAITQQLTTKDIGVDLIAERAGRRLLVEAKGYTSGSPTSARFGKPFNKNQLWDHAAKAIYKALKVVSAGDDLAGIALLNDPRTVEVIEAVQPALEQLRIEVIWVEYQGEGVAHLPPSLT